MLENIKLKNLYSIDESLEDEIIIAFNDGYNDTEEATKSGYKVIVSSFNKMNCFLPKDGERHSVYYNVKDAKERKCITIKNLDDTWNVIWE